MREGHPLLGNVVETLMAKLGFTTRRPRFNASKCSFDEKPYGFMGARPVVVSRCPMRRLSPSFSLLLSRGPLSGVSWSDCSMKDPRHSNSQLRHLLHQHNLHSIVSRRTALTAVRRGLDGRSVGYQ